MSTSNSTGTNPEKLRQRADLTNQTVLSTPKPRASSTTQKQQIVKQLNLKKVPFDYSPKASVDVSTESLGILCLDNYQITSSLNSTGIVQPQFTNEKLQQQRSLASSLLEKSTKGYGLPSRYLKASDTLKSCTSPSFSIGSDSTVNESDLLRLCINTEKDSNVDEEKISFIPADISTPRSSCASNESYSSRQSVCRTSISESLAQLSQQIKNSNTDLSELCEQFSKLDSLNFSQASIFSDESFVGGDLAIEKMKEREQSWRKEHDILGNYLKSDSISSQLENLSLLAQERSSITDFFRKKSELAEFCLKESPERDSGPVALINKSLDHETAEQTDIIQNISAISKYSDKSSMDESVLSISEIEKVIASNDNTTRIMECMFEKPPTAKINDKILLKKSKTSRPFTAEDFHIDDTKENRGLLYRKSSDSYKFRSSSVEPLREYTSNITDKSTSSLHTASSLESLPGGKLPIESNRIELVWGCVPIGKRKTQTFILRNKSQNKLRLQLRSSNTCFKIVNDRSEADPVQVLPILLYPAESRLFSVSFTPSAMGAAAEKLSFTPINSELQAQQTKRQQLNLYGYGGYAKCEIQNVLKDTNMKMWLALGKLGETLQLSQKFTIKNAGTLTAFSCLGFNSKALYGYSKVTVYPTEIVLKPQEEISITLTYTPTKDDIKHVFATTSNQIIEIGSIQVITGDEPLRGRIRRLYKKLKQEGGAIGNPLIERLSKTFPNEKMLSDINRFSETVGCMKELLQYLISKEIIITLERDSDSSSMGHIAGIDESSMFHSLAEGITTIISNTCTFGLCTVEPTNVILTPPAKREDNIILTNQNTKSLQFQTSLSNTEVLQVSPSEGILLPGETILLKISCNIKKILQQQEVYKLSVYVDDDMFDVDIKIILVKSQIRK